MLENCAGEVQQIGGESGSGSRFGDSDSEDGYAFCLLPSMHPFGYSVPFRRLTPSLSYPTGVDIDGLVINAHGAQQPGVSKATRRSFH